MDSSVFWIIFALLTAAYFVIGTYFGNLKSSSNDDFFLAGRNLNFFSLSFTLIATQLGAGMLVGTADEAYRLGIYGVFYNLGICLGFLALGLGIAAKLRAYNVATTAEIFQSIYKSTFLRKVASILSIITLGGILSSQILASRKLLVALHLNNDIFLIIFWLSVISYTMMGGLKAVVATDIFQVCLIIVVFVGIFIYAIVGDFANNFDFSLLAASQSEQSFDYYYLLGLLITPMLFCVIEQDLAQRFFAAKNKAIALKSSLFASLFIISFSVIPIYLGIKCKLLSLPFASNSTPLIAFIKYLTGDIVTSLAICAIIAAISSTADSLICAISSNIVVDFNIGQAKNKYLIRMITFAVGCIALFIAYHSDNILYVIKVSYEISISCLFISIFFSFIKKNFNKLSAILSIFLGAFSFIILALQPQFYPRELISLCVSGFAYLLGDLYCFIQKDRA